MKKFLIFAAAMAAIILSGCGHDVPADARPRVAIALRELGVPVKCLEIKDVKKVEGEKDSYSAVAVCDINGEKQEGDITVKYKNGKPEIGIIGFGYPEIMTIKTGALGIDGSRTVAAALSANLEDLKWEKYLNRKNQIIVKASGVWVGGTLSFGEPKFFIVRPGKEVEVYFTINTQGKFSFITGKIFGPERDLGITEQLFANVDSSCNEVDPDNLEKLKGGFLAVLYN